MAETRARQKALISAEVTSTRSTPGVVRVLHDAFKEALFDPAHLAVIARFDMPVRYLNSTDYAVAAAAHYQDERRTVQELGLKLG